VPINADRPIFHLESEFTPHTRTSAIEPAKRNVRAARLRRNTKIFSPTMMTADDEWTIMEKCAKSGVASQGKLSDEYADALPASTRLHEFEILSVIGQGGFGIVYLAHDQTLDRLVAIKEYMPSALATRAHDKTAAVRSSRHTEIFNAGLRSFINEAQLLARFDHPSLVKVLRFWHDHGTAYMVMPYYAGPTLGKHLASLEGPPTEAWLRARLNPLLDALELMHAAHCFHRDIAPDNILLLPDNRPLLLDFGAARRVIGDMTQALTVILKTGYAPIEQYGEFPGMHQGAWTDLYALGSVVEFAVTGHTPPQALVRSMADKRQPLAAIAAGRYSDAFLEAIDRSLAVLPKNRPQSVAEFRTLMSGRYAAAPQVSAKKYAGRMSALTKSAASAVLANKRKEQVQGPIDESNVARPSVALSESSTSSTTGLMAATPSAASLSRSRVIAAGGIAVLGVIGLGVSGNAWLGAHRQNENVTALLAVRTPQEVPVAVVSGVGSSENASQVPVLEETPRTSSDHSTWNARSDFKAEPANAFGEVAKSSVPAILPVPPLARPLHAVTAVPRAGHNSVPETHIVQRSPKDLPSKRCEDIVQRTTLGEVLSDSEKGVLKQECSL
jgi:serine/threonine protein kinase